MVYAWKTKYYDCDANVAGNELNRIYKKNGCLTPQSVVDESRNENAPLHNCFEWNDTTAAIKYREQQARVLIANITVVEEADEKTVEPVRAFYHIQQDYKPIDVVIKNADMMEELLEKAKKELNAFRRKYSALSQLQPIFDAIERMECA